MTRTPPAAVPRCCSDHPRRHYTSKLTILREDKTIVQFTGMPFGMVVGQLPPVQPIRLTADQLVKRLRQFGVSIIAEPSAPVPERGSLH